MRCVLVTGTSTGVGKTVTTAVLAQGAVEAGVEVAVVKPVQTGAALDEPTDCETIRTLTGCRHVTELVSLDEPLAPDTAARRAGTALPSAGDLARRIVELGHRTGAELLLVEGAGGILVRLDTEAGTLLTIATELSKADIDVSFVVVTSLALGTLNHSELTVRAITDAGHPTAGLVVGSRPERLGLAEQVNLTELSRVTSCPLLGAIPDGVGQWDAARFRAGCGSWLDLAPVVHGRR